MMFVAEDKLEFNELFLFCPSLFIILLELLNILLIKRLFSESPPLEPIYIPAKELLVIFEL